MHSIVNILKLLRIDRITDKPLLLFSPFLIIYLAIALVFKTDGSFGDEGVYLKYAENLLQGYYSPPGPVIELRKGPGYPILLMPFVALDLPLVWITVLNATLYYFSIVLLYKLLIRYCSLRISLIVSFFWALHINNYETISWIYTEILTLFLVTIIMVCLVKAFDHDKNKNPLKYLILSGFFIGYLALTKPIFGYVLLVMLGGTSILWIINRRAENYRKGTIILLLALFTTLPYLFYTYNLTGKFYYWTTTGGEVLYWMSAPYEGDYGNWKSVDSFETDTFFINHRENLREILSFKGMERDEAFKRFALENIKSHPLKYIQNCFSNLGRILFNFPYTNNLQKPGSLIRLPFNGVIVIFMLFSIIPTFKNWRKIPYSIRFSLLFAFIYLGGSVLVPAYTRMFTAIVPVILFWIAYIINKTIRINLKFEA